MNRETRRPSEPIYTHIVRGSAWGLATRFGVRSIGMVSTIILARLLTPEDFGIMAIASLTLGLLEIFSEMGVDLFLMREARVEREHFDTAWTLNLLRGLLVGLLLVLLAPFCAMYFEEPRAVAVVRWMALAAAIRGTTNIGLVFFRRELQFDKDFRFGLYRRLATLLVTIPLAAILRSYWALVVGNIIGAALEVIVSYRMQSYRPQLSLGKVRDILSFSINITLWTISRFFNDRIDTFVIGRVGQTSRLGEYNVASELSQMATQEPLTAVSRGLFPSFAKVIDQPHRFTPTFLSTFGAITTLLFALGTGLSMVSNDVVQVILGEQWTGAAPLLQWLALYSLLRSISQLMIGNFPLMRGGERLAMYLNWARLLILVPSVTFVAVTWGVNAVPVAGTFVAAAFLPFVAFATIRVLPLTLTQLAAVVWRPIVASVAMIVVLIHFHSAASYALVRLVADVAVGAATYVTALLSLWQFSGRPPSIEGILYQFVADRLHPSSSGSTEG